MDPPRHRGRFAPTPSGPLHFGSLVAALGSFLEARARGGQWLLRIDDLDAPRNRPGAAAEILRQLQAHGLYWDGAVDYQSAHQERYDAALAQLIAAGAAYPCGCTRAAVRAAGGVYPGTCRAGLPAGRTARAWRLHVDGAEVSFHDRIHGAQRVALAQQCGDFVLRRADGIHAYHLATVVDDAALGITEIVRGADLLPVTARQILLAERLGLPVPAYAHLPVACNAQGQKLSKQTGAKPLPMAQALNNLLAAWAFLGQQPMPERPASVAEFLRYAASSWHLLAARRAVLAAANVEMNFSGPRNPAEQAMSFKNVEVNIRANVYHDGRVTSRTLITADGAKKTLGVMLPGRYVFTTDTPERIDVTQGRCRVHLDQQPAGPEYRAGEHFGVPAHTRFEIEVIELLDYVCHFG